MNATVTKGDRSAGGDIMPSQIVSGARYDSLASPEKGLMIALLEDAIRCFQGSWQKTTSNKRLQVEATEWIEDTDVEWPFSFINVCETLGVEPRALRASLHRWRDTAVDQRPEKIVNRHLTVKGAGRGAVRGRPIKGRKDF